MLGIVPAAGAGSRIQPLAFSKELLPVAARNGDGLVRPKAVAEFVVDRMLAAGADRICMVVAPDKADVLRYFGRLAGYERLFFVLQPQPAGLCDALFRAARHVRPDEMVLIGLPDTVWEPANAYALAPRDCVHLITFPVREPSLFDAVRMGAGGRVERVEVKAAGPIDRRVWGAITAPGEQFLGLEELWRRRGARDLFLGHLLNAWLEAGREISADCQGTAYRDVGTWAGFRAVIAPAGAEAAARSERGG